MIAEVIQAGLQNLQHLFAGYAATLERAFVNTAKLPLQQPVVVTQLLLLDEPQTIIGVLAAGLGAVDARAIIAALQIFGGAKDGNAESAADADARTCVTSHIKV